MKTIIQKIRFQAPPKTLFEIYMDSKKHSLATGGKAVIRRKPGETFSAHGGYIKGKNLMVVPGEMILQTWRGKDWVKKDRDSILLLIFEPAKGGSLLTMVHTRVPDRHAGHLSKGWKDHYWRPWKRYLKAL